ncbi:MAG: choice-of-anchor B family protein, partial [Candidatus Zixiibacteriota bacterium]
MSDKNNPRRLNLCILECYSCSELPIQTHNGRWDPDTSANGKFEFLFVMRSDYDSTGMTYAGRNILSEDLDNLYAWWPRVASGHTFFETDTASLTISPLIGLNLLPYDDSITLSWVYPGNDPHHFKIYYSIDSLAESFLIQVDGSDRAFKHGGLIPEQEYFYQVKSFDSTDTEIYGSRTKRAKTRLISLGIELFGQWNGRNDYGGIWGYTDSATGLEYALLCSRSLGLSIIDINNSPPVEVGFVSQSVFDIGTQEVRTYGHYAVTVMDGLASGIIDLADVTDPQVISIIPNGQHTLQVYKDYAIFAGGGAPTGVEIYDISNPYNPTFVSFYSPYYYHDYAIRNDTLAAFGIYGDGIDLIDITDIYSPQPIGHFNYTGSGAHNGVFSEDGRYLFVGDEIGNGNWTRVFDISDINNVEHISDIIVNPNKVVHNCEIIGPHLYIAHYDLGLRVWNVADPAEPFEVAFYDTGPHPNFQYTGAWGVYPYFASGKIILSDMQNGLFVFTSTLLDTDCCQGER